MGETRRRDFTATWVVLAVFLSAVTWGLIDRYSGAITLVQGSIVSCIPKPRGARSVEVMQRCSAQLHDGSTVLFESRWPMATGTLLEFRCRARRFSGHRKCWRTTSQ